VPPPPPITEEPAEEEWLVTYADAITILMAFFVMLVSFSKIDLPLFDKVMAGIKNEIGMGKNTGASISQKVQSALESAAFQMSMEQVVDVQKDSRGIVIEMASTSFFKPGTAQLIDSALPLLKKWSAILTQDQFKYFFIEVEGHTDDDPIHTPKFPSNWELSAGRAAAVVRNMQGHKVQPFQLKVTGLGDSHPKVPNRDLNGNPIKANQAKNRRVIIRLIQMGKADKEAFDTVLLKQRLAKEERKRRAAEAAKRKAVQDALNAAAAASAPAAPAPTAPAPTAPAPAN